MKKQLVKIGSNFGIIIDEPLLDSLGITIDTPIEVTIERDSLVLRPVRTISESDAAAAYERVATKHQKSFKRLSE